MARCGEIRLRLNAHDISRVKMRDMSGHSKWSTIKHKKAANDKVKGSVFTKMAKALTIAVKKGGGVAEAIERARSVNMPRENIDRAIAKGMGRGDAEEMVELTIEAFGPEGVMIIIEVITDNRNRAVAEVRNRLEKHGGRMGEPGSVMYAFEKKEEGYHPRFTIPVENRTRIEEFLDAVMNYEDVQEVYANLA